MTRHKTAKPAPARHGKPVSNSEQLGGELDRSNTLSPAKLQAPPSPPDDAGESDLAYFAARPHLDSRLRLPFDFELPSEIWQAAADAGVAGFVVVTRGAPGAVWIRSRKFVFAAGGTA
jgi:hypothetical protein